MTGLRPQIEKNVGLIYYNQNDIPEAIRHLRKSIELDPSLIDAYFILGQSYLKNKDNKKRPEGFRGCYYSGAGIFFCRQSQKSSAILKITFNNIEFSQVLTRYIRCVT